jgi:hypothetical protein
MLQATFESINRRLKWADTPSQGMQVALHVEMVRPPVDYSDEDAVAAAAALYSGKPLPEAVPVELMETPERECCTDTCRNMVLRTEHVRTPFKAECQCGAVFRLSSEMDRV